MNKISAVIPLLIVFPLIVIASEDPALDEELRLLHEAYSFTITASKVREAVGKTVATTTVIDQKQIQAMGARNLLDVLKLVPGIGITQTAYGLRQIEVRGVHTTFSEKVLLLLNGHPLDHNLLTASSVMYYDDLLVDSIKRIEIVRGPGSALYGANAFLAVINIITQEASDLKGAHISVGGGSFGTKQFRTSWGKQFANSFEAAVHFNFTDTDGIGTPLFTDATRTTLGKSQFAERRSDFEWQLGYNDFKFEGRYMDTKQGTFFGVTNKLSDNRTTQEYEDYFFKLSRKWNLNKYLSLDTQIFYDTTTTDGAWEVAPNLFLFTGLHDTRLGGEIQANYVFSPKQTLITGFSFANETHGDLRDSIGTDPAHSVPTLHTSTDKKRNRWGVYAQDIWEPFSNLRLTLGSRYDEYNDFGGTFNPRVGFNWEFIKNYSLKFSYGTAYRAPAFGELTLVNNPTLEGNPTLTPEKVKTFEGGIIAHPISQLTTQLTYYYSDINKIISSVQLPTSIISRYVNSGQIIAQGIELEGRYDFSGNLKGSYLSANSVWQDTMQDGHRVADVPRFRTNLMANWAIDKTWSSFAHLLVKSNTSRVLGDIRPNAPGYAVVDLGIVGKNILNQKFDLGFNIYNLFDKRYYDPSPASIGFAGDFQMAGIAYFGHISVHF